MKIENLTIGSHEVEDWEFQFSSGSAMQITVDVSLGDQFEFNPEAPTAYFKIAEKDSPVDPDGRVPEEELFIPMRNVLCVRRLKRMVEPIPLEQKEEWQNLLREMSGRPELAN